MVKGVTKSGFKFELDDEAMDDLEFVELLAESDMNPSVIPQIVKTILGEKQYAELKEHLRNDKGRIPMSAVDEALTEMFEAAGESVKNS